MIQSILILFIITLALTTCSIPLSRSYKKNFNSSQWQEYQQKIYFLHKYQMNGTVTFFSDKQKINAYFFWQQISQNHYQLLITNLFGNTEFKIHVKSGLVQLFNNKGLFYTSNNLIKTTIGKIINSPLILVDNLPQWILGLPGNATNYKLNKRHQLSEICYFHNGKPLKIIYNNYDNAIEPILPTSIEIIQDNQRIKFKIKKLDY